MELPKFLLTLWVFGETSQTWTTFSKLKALVGLEKFRVIVFSTVQKTITQNSEFSLASMIQYVKVKFKVIVFRQRAFA